MAGNKYANLIIIASVYWILSKCSVHLICFLNAVSVSHCPILEWCVPHWFKKSSTHFFQLRWCSSLSLLRLPVWSFFTALLLGSPFPHAVYFPFVLLPEDPSADARLALFWHCLLRVCSQCCQCGSRQLLTQSVSPLWARDCLLIRAKHSCLCFSECSAVSLPWYRVVGAQLLAYPGTWRSALWSNYLIWGNYL